MLVATSESHQKGRRGDTFPRTRKTFQKKHGATAAWDLPVPPHQCNFTRSPRLTSMIPLLRRRLVSRTPM